MEGKTGAARLALVIGVSEGIGEWPDTRTDLFVARVSPAGDRVRDYCGRFRRLRVQFQRDRADQPAHSPIRLLTRPVGLPGPCPVGPRPSLPRARDRAYQAILEAQTIQCNAHHSVF